MKKNKTKMAPEYFVGMFVFFFLLLIILCFKCSKEMYDKNYKTAKVSKVYLVSGEIIKTNRGSWDLHSEYIKIKTDSMTIRIPYYQIKYIKCFNERLVDDVY